MIGERTPSPPPQTLDAQDTSALLSSRVASCEQTRSAGALRLVRGCQPGRVFSHLLLLDGFVVLFGRRRGRKTRRKKKKKKPISFPPSRVCVMKKNARDPPLVRVVTARPASFSRKTFFLSLFFIFTFFFFFFVFIHLLPKGRPLCIDGRLGTLLVVAGLMGRHLFHVSHPGLYNNIQSLFGALSPPLCVSSILSNVFWYLPIRCSRPRRTAEVTNFPSLPPRTNRDRQTLTRARARTHLTKT